MQTEKFPAEENGAYNRRTTDYGNGKMEIAAYHSPRFRHTGIRNGAYTGDAVLSDEAQEARTKKQICAIRRRIKGYALSNCFQWFATLTFSPAQVNSRDYGTAKDTLLKWCRQMRDRYSRSDYLLVPELHQSGAVHFHGLPGSIPADFVEAVNPKTGTPLVRRGRPVYNLADWTYGFSDCEKIETPEKAASYITKYITSALLSDKEMYNKKRYFNSQGLVRPTVTLEMADNSELDAFTPNFGVVGTGADGTNFVDIGIYNLAMDKETGALMQTDTGHLILAKASPLGGQEGGLKSDRSPEGPRTGGNRGRGNCSPEQNPTGTTERKDSANEPHTGPHMGKIHTDD